MMIYKDAKLNMKVIYIMYHMVSDCNTSNSDKLSNKNKIYEISILYGYIASFQSIIQN